MTVTVDAKNFKLTEALREFARQQAERLFKLSKKMQSVHIHLETVTKKHNDPSANMVIFHIGIPGKEIVVKAHGVDMYEAISEASQSALRQVRKTYEKRRTKRRVALSEVFVE